MNEQATILLTHLTIGYAAHKQAPKVVARDISASLCAGRLTCLIGPNGIGKSTLLRTLCAFQPKIGGSIQLFGKELDTYTERQLARLIGIVLTSKPEVQNMTVAELVGMGRSPYTGFWGTLTDSDHAIVRQAMQQVGIETLAGRRVGTLSDGERQKAMIAKALAQQTPVVVLDEPTAFLDYPSKVEMMQLLHRLSREMQKTIFLSTHDLELTLQIADTIWLMQQDHLHIGTAQQLAADGSLASFIEREGITFDRETLRVMVK